MIAKRSRPLGGLALSKPVLALTLLASTALAGSFARADDDDFRGFRPDHLLLSRAVFVNNAVTITPGVTQLPPGCVGSNCAAAVADGTYPTVFNNDTVDGSFGLTAKILLDELHLDGRQVQSLEVPNSAQRGVSQNKDQMVTSFSSKSELALNLSLDHHTVTFMGYLAPIGTLDVSNSNTPLVVDPTNPVTGAYYRMVAEVDQNGRFHFTESNAYSGNNGRAAILNDRQGVFYTSGNAGNGGKTQPVGIIAGTGTQIMTEADAPLAQQNAGQPTPVGSFNVTELGDTVDKIGKDTNFRGLTVFNNVIYTTKGSGGNGINTVYFIDTSGFDPSGKPLACPTGVGVPNPTASLPTAPIAVNPMTVQSVGVTPYNMCVLKGFPTILASKNTTAFPFGVWFANANTLYVADEGNGTVTFDPTSNTYTSASSQTTAGLQKWVFNGTTWTLAYTLQAGLGLGVPYTVPGYPTGPNAGNKNLPWSPATDGLRNITGRVNRDGTATIWAITSTVSGSGDQGADPNKLVMITDKIAASTLPSGESFVTLRTANAGEALRGISFTPGTDLDHDREAHDHGSCDRDHRDDDCRDDD